jgi:hypothetical protein
MQSRGKDFLLASFIFLALFTVLPSLAHAQASGLVAPAGKTIARDLGCSSLPDTTQSCRVDFTDGTHMNVVTNSKGDVTTVFTDKDGKTISSSTVTRAQQAQASADQAQQSSRVANTAAASALQSTVTAAEAALRAPAGGTSSISATEAAALVQKIRNLESRGLITTAQKDALQQMTVDGAAAKLSPAQARALTDVSKAYDAAQTASTAAATASNASTAAQEAATATQNEDKSCNFFLGGNLKTCLVKIMFDLIKQITLFFLFLAMTFAGIAGFLFNWTVYITVFQFGNIIGNNAGMLAAWGVLRDIGNIILLFGFIFMGISTILNLPGNEFTARKALPALIIFAVLMNFSLFAAEAVIDTSNALGSTFYNQANQGTCPSGQIKICATEFGIAGSIMKLTGIASIFHMDPNNKKDGNLLGNTEPAGAIAALGLTVFAAVTAFVFFAGMFLLITRAVVLAFLMAVSPIGFAGMAIPPLHEFASMWWNQLLKQSFFAPIFILLILVSIKFMEGITAALSAGTTGAGEVATLASAFSTSGTSNVSMVVNFILIIGFMLGSLQIAKSMGAMGADRATKFAGAATFGTTAFIGRRTGGRASAFVANQLRSSKFAETGLGRFAVGMADKGAHSSFDGRTNKLIAGGFKAAKIDAGTVGKTAAHGYHGIEEKAVKDRVDYAKSLKDRNENSKEFTARKEEEKAASLAAETEVATATTAEADAQAARALQKAHRDNAARSLAEQKALVAQNPGNADAQAALSQMEDQLQRENRELADADATLAEAKKKLAEHRAKEAKANEVLANTKLGKVDAKQRRTNFADSIQHQTVYPGGPEWTKWIDPTATSLANHHAADAIKSYGAKSTIDRILGDLGDEFKKSEKNERGPETHEEPKGGGGPSHIK